MKHEGTFTFLHTVTFSKKEARMSPGFVGSANVYAFEPADPAKTKVRYAAVVTGVRHEVMCTASGDVEKAILKAAGLDRAAKGAASPTAEYDVYPDPVGCPMDKLQSRAAEQALVFYARAK